MVLGKNMFISPLKTCGNDTELMYLNQKSFTAIIIRKKWYFTVNVLKFNYIHKFTLYFCSRLEILKLFSCASFGISH